MRVVITCGPGYEPVDEVRRLTNFSTGELGIRLANRFTEDGHDVFCLKGEAATYAGDCRSRHLFTFSTNDDLLAKLHSIPGPQTVDLVLHCAALCDFKVKRVQSATGEALTARKISSRAGDLTIVLEPAAKIISHLRSLFPKAQIVGWKYELDISRAEALSRARRQISENHTDLCVVNGHAFGSGFVVTDLGRDVFSATDKAALVDWLAQQLPHK